MKVRRSARLRLAGWVLSVVVAGAVVVACGGSSSGPGPATSSTTSSAAPTTTAASSSAAPSTPATSSTATAAAGSECATQNLRLAQGAISGVAGGGYLTATLRNAGTTSCELRGFPGVSVLDAAGKIIQRPADRDSTPTALVTLAPGQAAQFAVRFSDPLIPGTDCPAAMSGPTELQVYPPDQTVPLRAPTSLTPCDLVVGPVMAAG